jgi:P-type E1-E2 ATPase
VLSHFETDATNGITTTQVVSQRELYGSNALEQVKPKNPLVMLFFHVFSSVSFILFAVFALAMVNDEYIDAAVIMFIVFANAIIGWVQEWKSERSLNALQRMSAGTADVIRNGISETIGIAEVVVGDIISLKQGSQVPADARLIQAINLEIDEALLTGESMPVNKHTAALEKPKQVQGLDVRVALGDRTNMVFRQTNVVVGTGMAVVTAVGYDTKVGQLSKALAAGGDQKTPMQKNMDKFLLVIFGLAIFIAFVIFAITEFTFDKDTTIYASATGVAILPESLIAVVTVTLALAVTRMSKKKAVVRKIASVETLGSTQAICSDKTGMYR